MPVALISPTMALAAAPAVGPPSSAAPGNAESTQYSREHPPQLYSSAQVTAGRAAEELRFDLVALPVTAVVVLGIAAFFESRRLRRSGDSDGGGSAWLDGDFDDGGD